MKAHELVIPPEYLYSHKTIHDSDEQAESLIQWDQRYEQLTVGQFEGALTQMWFEGMQLFRESTNCMVKQSGTCWDDCIVIGVPIQMNSQGLFAGNAFDNNHLFIFNHHDGFDLTTPEYFDLVAIALPRSHLQDHLNQLELDKSNQHLNATPCVLKPESAQLLQLHQCLNWALNPSNFQPEMLRFPNVRRYLHATILEHLVHNLKHAKPAPKPSPSFKGRSRIVRQAIDYMMSHLESPPTINEICVELNISRRMFNYCFQDVIGMNPVAYLRAIRLNGVRRELRQHHNNLLVKEVAMKWGFWHLPHFARDYQALFGELPSQTSMRRRLA